KQRFRGRPVSLRNTPRPDDGQRSPPFCDVARMQHPPHQSGEMIAVQMRYEDDGNGIGIEAHARHPDQGCSTTIDQTSPVSGRKVKTGLEAATRAKCVTGSNDRKLHAEYYSIANIVVSPETTAVFPDLPITFSLCVPTERPELSSIRQPPLSVKDLACLGRARATGSEEKSAADLCKPQNGSAPGCGDRKSVG